MINIRTLKVLVDVLRLVTMSLMLVSSCSTDDWMSVSLSSCLPRPSNHGNTNLWRKERKKKLTRTQYV